MNELAFFTAVFSQPVFWISSVVTVLSFASLILNIKAIITRFISFMVGFESCLHDIENQKEKQGHQVVRYFHIYRWMVLHYS